MHFIVGPTFTKFNMILKVTRISTLYIYIIKSSKKTILDTNVCAAYSIIFLTSLEVTFFFIIY
jgi:hypothetical protein